VLAAQLIAFFGVGLYRGNWGYESAKDIGLILKGVALGTIGTQLAIIVIYQYFSHSIPVFIIYAVTLAVLVTISRIFERGIIRYFVALSR